MPKSIAIGNAKSIRDYLHNHLPDFAWQTPQEILTMIEQAYEDINEGTIKKQISIAVSLGFLDRKPIRSSCRYLYKRKTDE